MSAGNPAHDDLMAIVQNFPDCSEYKERWESAVLELKKSLEEKCSLTDLLNKALGALKSSQDHYAVISVKVETYVEAGLLTMGKRSFEPTVKKYFLDLIKAANALLNPRGWKFEHVRPLTHSGVAGGELFFYHTVFEVGVI